MKLEGHYCKNFLLTKWHNSSTNKYKGKKRNRVINMVAGKHSHVYVQLLFFTHALVMKKSIIHINHAIPIPDYFSCNFTLAL